MISRQKVPCLAPCVAFGAPRQAEIDVITSRFAIPLE
jgi:hypothetical protein